MRKSALLSLALTIALLCTVGSVALAQPKPPSLKDRIKERATKKVEDRKAETEDKVVETTGKMVDSSVEKTGRGVDATVEKVGTVMDTAMNRTERGVAAAGKSLGIGDDDKIATDLAAGRAVVREIDWINGGAELGPQGQATLERVASALKGSTAIYLIEAHTADSGAPAANQALAEQRAAAVKAKLVAEGVPTGRLFAMAFGATRPPTDGGAAARVEFAKMQ